MDEEISLFESERKYDPISVCKCLKNEPSTEPFVSSERKLHILSTVSRTENYLRERRIPELVRFLLTKLIANMPQKPILFLEKLLDDCMLFRAGHGLAPVLYERKHLEAVIKSFDPGRRGWLSAGQTRRMFSTLDLTPTYDLDERVHCDVVLENLQQTQEAELFSLLSAGIIVSASSEISSKSDIDL